MAFEINPWNVVKLLNDVYSVPPFGKETPMNAYELVLMNHIRYLLTTRRTSAEYTVEFENNLDFEDIISLDESSDEDQYDAYDPGEGSSSEREYVSLEKKRKAVEFWESGVQKKYRSLDAVQKNFRFVHSLRQLYRWKEQLTEGGSKFDKYKVVNDHVFEKFLIAKKNSRIIHDRDLRRWAVIKANEIGIEPQFSASKHWLHDFKTKRCIVSRKITKFVSRNFTRDLEEIRATATAFVTTSRKEIQNYLPNCVFNTDQCGINIELHAGRTLDIHGERHIRKNAQSVNATTHSYTVQPTISLDGKLLSLLFVCWQVPGKGVFGPRVPQAMFRATNLYITASKSGKLSAELVADWEANVLFPNVPQSTVLFADSWTGHNNLGKNPPANKELKFLNIPPNTTWLVQPLDVHFFRTWKQFIRIFYDYVLLDEIDIKLYERDNVLKLLSLVHNQFSSPRLENLIKYAFFTCGYIQDRPLHFINPIEYAFDSKDEKCFVGHNSGSPCISGVFIKCLWCTRSLCFEHFYNNYHYCEDYIAE